MAAQPCVCLLQHYCCRAVCSAQRCGREPWPATIFRLFALPVIAVSDMRAGVWCCCCAPAELLLLVRQVGLSTPDDMVAALGRQFQVSFDGVRAGLAGHMRASSACV